MDPAEIKKMSTADRIQTMEALWDSLISEESFIASSPSWHEDILNERREKIKNKDTEFISLQKLKDSKRI